ncbi:ABC transporter ATP-binding protein [Niveibacterium microcysteis]|uniref:ABC transporter ATP-binding protein n=1 Tax=Niveibacterium microcysteis TaxID=2811415 RepID=A0ABX7MDW8_9RHOO|nr:ABC transporter ATP-binding protein [Niveibacterium microcysteis]QSI79069.1 ABC transporter ATP-binding protein [Niveibacterium microcysteis]
MSFVRFENVSLAYTDDGPRAIEDVNLDVREGEFVAVVGPSGCGKSTLMKLVSGLRLPNDGYVYVNGRQVGGPLNLVGMAFQAANLLPWRTTLQNVMLPMEIVEPYRSELRSHRAEFEQRARAQLAAVGLAGCEDKFPWELSGGMQQRASICRALIHKPRLLMLDEPFGALDAFTREELWCMLRDLWQTQPFTVILVTHDLREAVFLADTVYVMSARPGRILVRREIDLARPRDLDLTYTDHFASHVHALREHIGHVRKH